MNLLINPTSIIQSGYTPIPLGLLYMAAMDEDTEVLDAARLNMGIDDVVDYIERTKPQVVGVPIYTIGRHGCLDVLRVAKKSGAVTVAGGPHVAVMTDQLVDHYSEIIDHFVIGDGEKAWEWICDYYNAVCKGFMQPPPPVIRHNRGGDLDDLPLPAWDKVDLLTYPARGDGVYRGNDLSVLPRISVVLGRGCSGRCNFCSTWWVNGKPRQHGMDWMRRNLQTLWDRGVRHLCWYDDNLTDSRDAVMGLCEILREYNFSWHATARADCFDEETAVAMRDAGCYEISFGIESGSPEILGRMNKHLDVSKSFETRRICQDLGIRFTALIVQGYPGETPELKAVTNLFLEKLKPDGIGTLGSTWVLPGTALYRDCKRAGLIDDDFWLGPEPYYLYRGGLS